MSNKIKWDDLTTEQRLQYINNVLDYCRHLGIKIHIIKEGDSYINGYGEECIMEPNFKECNFITREIWLEESEAGEGYQINLFDILHELGHIQTNNLDMSVYEMEYRATQYAIDVFHFLNLEIAHTTESIYSDYPKRFKEDEDEDWELIW